jgi:hypothetical protein
MSHRFNTDETRIKAKAQEFVEMTLELFFLSVFNLCSIRGYSFLGDLES